MQAIGANTSVSSKELKAALGEEHWQAYQTACEYRKAQLDQYEVCKRELRDYIRLLRIADINDHSADTVSQRGRQRKSTAMPRDTGYERAIERLQELLEADPTLQQFLDRGYDFDTWLGNNDISRHGVPRPIFHKTQVFEKIEHQQIPSVRELKVEALEKAIDQPTISTQLAEKRDGKAELEQNMKNLNSLLKLVRR